MHIPQPSIGAPITRAPWSPVVSTLSEIAANLLKLETLTPQASANSALNEGMGWEQLMALSQEKDIVKWQAALSELIDNNPGKRRVTVLRVIEGGLA